MKYLKTLNELRQQGELPFNGGDPIKDKPMHIHLIDAIQYLDQKTKVNPENFITNNHYLDNYYNENFEKGFNTFVEIMDGEIEYYQNDFIQAYGDNEYYFTESPSDSYEFEDFITKEGLEVFEKEFLKDTFEDNIYQYNFLYNLEQDDSGLVKIWRGITLDENDDMKDTYEKIIDYDGVGVFWSWDMGGAYPHSGLGGGKGYFVFSAWVRPEDIDWSQTILKNGYELREEKEIEVKDKALVMIDSLYKYEGSKKIKFHEGEYIVRT